MALMTGTGLVAGFFVNEERGAYIGLGIDAAISLLLLSRIWPLFSVPYFFKGKYRWGGHGIIPDHLPNQASALLLTATAHAFHRVALFSLLLAADTADSNGQTPVLLLCRSINEYPETLETRLAAGASPSRPDSSGDEPLHHAAARNHIELVKILLEAGAAPNSSAAHGSTPMH